MAQKQTISDLQLEQYALGELSGAQELRVREELGRDVSLRARLSAIEDSNKEILAAYPPEQIVAQIKEKLFRQGATAARAPRRVNVLTWALPAAAMVAIFLSFFIVREGVVPDETRLKGMTPHLNVFRKTMRGAEELPAGVLARRGDVLQLAYSAGEAKFGVILSVDGRGTVTWHVPSGYSGGSLSAPSLDPKGQVVLPAAYELDDAPGFERFFFVYSSKPFDVASVDRAARALATRPSSADREPLGLGGGLGQYSLLVKKQG
jgi:hypothetical protein